MKEAEELLSASISRAQEGKPFSMPDSQRRGYNILRLRTLPIALTAVRTAMVQVEQVIKMEEALPGHKYSPAATAAFGRVLPE